MAQNYGSTYVKHILQQNDDKDKSIRELVISCQMSLNWINNLVYQVGQDSVLNAMPNNCGGRLQLADAIDKGLSTLDNEK